MRVLPDEAVKLQLKAAIVSAMGLEETAALFKIGLPPPPPKEEGEGATTPEGATPPAHHILTTAPYGAERLDAAPAPRTKLQHRVAFAEDSASSEGDAGGDGRTAHPVPDAGNGGGEGGEGGETRSATPASSSEEDREGLDESIFSVPEDPPLVGGAPAPLGPAGSLSSMRTGESPMYLTPLFGTAELDERGGPTNSETSDTSGDGAGPTPSGGAAAGAPPVAVVAVATPPSTPRNACGTCCTVQ